MQINIQEYTSNKTLYVESLKESAWTELKLSKFQNSPPTELEFIKTLWSHGFMRGAEIATELSTAIYNALKIEKIPPNKIFPPIK